MMKSMMMMKEVKHTQINMIIDDRQSISIYQKPHIAVFKIGQRRFLRIVESESFVRTLLPQGHSHCDAAANVKL